MRLLIIFTLLTSFNLQAEENLHKIFSEVYNLYKKEITQKFNLELKLIPNSGGSSIGRVEFTKDEIRIELRSELEKLEYFTMDAFAMVICHEIGHLVGGVPAEQTDFFGPTYIVSTEGQSDYFASLKCMKRYLKNKNNLLTKVDPIVKKKCSKAFSKNKEKQICMRTAMAGKEFMDLIATNSSFYDPKYPFEHNFKTPDKFVMTRDEVPFLGYPEDQCRLDTILAGALCKVKIESPMSYRSYSKDSCLGKGARPKCWFNRAQKPIHKD